MLPVWVFSKCKIVHATGNYFYLSGLLDSIFGSLHIISSKRLFKGKIKSSQNQTPHRHNAFKMTTTNVVGFSMTFEQLDTALRFFRSGTSDAAEVVDGPHFGLKTGILTAPAGGLAVRLLSPLLEHSPAKLSLIPEAVPNFDKLSL